MSTPPPASPPEQPPRRGRLRRVLLALAIVVGLVVGVVALAPSVLTPYVAGRLSALTGADVRIGWISWNPLRGRVVLHRLGIATTAADAPIVTLRGLMLDVAVRRWLDGEHAVDAIVLERPWIALRRTVRGDFNVATLFPALQADAAAAAETSPDIDVGPPNPVRIGVFRIVRGSVEFRDETLSPALETSLHLDDASARDLVLASDGSAGLAFHVESRLEDEPLTLDVTYDTATRSSHLKATLETTDTSLARALLYVPLGWQRTSGTMDAKITYERRFEEGTLRAHGLKANVTLNDLALTEPWATEPMLRAGRVRIPALGVDLVKQRTDLGAVQVDDYQTLVLRDDAQLHVPLATGSSEAAPSSWQTTLDRVSLGKGSATLRNVLAVPSVTIPVTSGTVRLPAAGVDFSFAGSLAGGQLTLDGTTRGTDTRLSFGLTDLSLAEAAPLVGSPLAFAKGRIGGTVELNLGASSSTYRGSLTSSDASTAPVAPHPEEILAWQTLALTLGESPIDPLKVHVIDAKATWPYVMLHRRTDGMYPFTLAGTSSTSSAPTRVTPKSTSSWFRLDRLTVEGGRIEFYDTTLPKPYGIDLTDLTASVDALALAPVRAERVSLEGAFDELSPATLTGRLDPSAAALRFDVDRLLLPPLNPYLAPALGYEVRTGFARIGSDVRFQGTKVAADTDLVLSRFSMRAAGTDAVGARIGTPLSVALALMKDTKGDIHLDLPIEGDVGANEYRVGSLLRDALGTALLGTLRAPLGFLRGLFRKDQGEQFDLRPVPFAAGDATLGTEGESRIGEIARLLGRQTAFRIVLIPEPSRADLQQALGVGATDPLARLAALADTRANIVAESLTGAHGIASSRVSIEPWTRSEPRIEGEPGVDVQLRAD
jgi:hypothetical protein